MLNEPAEVGDSLFEEEDITHSFIGVTSSVPPDNITSTNPTTSSFQSTIAPEVRTPVETPYTATPAVLKHLLNLLEQGGYAEARQVIRELLQLNVPIQASHIYEKAARNVLEAHEHLDSVQRLNEFTFWFSLIPNKQDDHLDASIIDDTVFKQPTKSQMEYYVPKSQKRIFPELSSANEKQPEPPFPEIIKLLLQNHITDLPMIIRFTLICAQKGYADGICPLVVPIITEFAEDKTLTRFIHEFESFPGMMQTDSWIKHRNAIVHGLMTARRLDYAFTLLPLERMSHRILPLKTYARFINLCQRDPSPTNEKYIESIRVFVLSIGQTLQLRSVTPREELDALEDDVSFTRLYRHLIRTLRSSWSPPSALDIHRFMKIYLEQTGKVDRIRFLEAIARDSGYRAISKFRLAELLFHYHRRDHYHVLKTWAHSFFMVGIPRDILVLYLKEQERDNEEDIFHPFGIQAQNWQDRAKIMPDPTVTAMLWHSLIRLSTSNEMVQRLYERMLLFAQGVHSDSLANMDSRYSHVRPLRIPRWWKKGTASGAFTPFMRPLMGAAGEHYAARGTQILRDAMNAGIDPDIHLYTELAGFMAKKGDISKVTFLLERMSTAHEVVSNRENPVAMDSSLAQDSVEPADSSPSVSQDVLGLANDLSANDNTDNARDIPPHQPLSSDDLRLYDQGREGIGRLISVGVSTEPSKTATNLEELPALRAEADGDRPVVKIDSPEPATLTEHLTAAVADWDKTAVGEVPQRLEDHLAAKEGSGKTAAASASVGQDKAAHSSSSRSSLSAHVASKEQVEPERVSAHMTVRDSPDELSRNYEYVQQPSHQTPSSASTLPKPDLPFYISIMRGFILAGSPEGVDATMEYVRKHWDLKMGVNYQFDLIMQDYTRLVNRNKSVCLRLVLVWKMLIALCSIGKVANGNTVCLESIIMWVPLGLFLRFVTNEAATLLSWMRLAT
jgi:hypothetical protein